jgi:hypothetical protein
MKVGLFINTQFPEGFNLTDRILEMIAQVRAARDAGFASLWFPHHWLTHPMQMLQITPVMGYVAAHAQGMAIGPNILILPPLVRSWTQFTASIAAVRSRCRHMTPDSVVRIVSWWGNSLKTSDFSVSARESATTPHSASVSGAVPGGS